MTKQNIYDEVKYPELAEAQQIMQDAGARHQKGLEDLEGLKILEKSLLQGAEIVRGGITDDELLAKQMLNMRSRLKGYIATLTDTHTALGTELNLAIARRNQLIAELGVGND